MLELPPRHGKSELASKSYPAYCIGRKPTKQIISASASNDLATDWARRCATSSRATSSSWSTPASSLPRTVAPPESGGPDVGLSTALAGPLLWSAGFESGVFHLCGPSSIGKTTLLRVAASVWGSGADNGYVRVWRATANGLEANMAGACDTLLPLDEVGQVDGKEIGQAIYMASSGVGKTRMTRDATLKASHKWRLLILSSGEQNLSLLKIRATASALSPVNWCERSISRPTAEPRVCSTIIQILIQKRSPTR